MAISRLFVKIEGDSSNLDQSLKRAMDHLEQAGVKATKTGERFISSFQAALNPTKRLDDQIQLLIKAGETEANIAAVLADRLIKASDAANKFGQPISEDVKRLTDLARASQSADAGISKFSASLKTIMGFLGAAGLGIGLYQITRGIINLGKESINMAVAAVESENLFAVSMGKMAQDAAKWSEEISKSLGLNAYEVRKNIGTFNVMFNSMGLGADKAYEMAKGLTQLAYDFASFYNLRPDEAFQKLQSGISGEIEPLRRLGVVVNEASVKTYAYATGVAKFGEELTEQQKIIARYGLILRQTSAAQGDLARTMESPANQMRALRSRVDQLQISLGMAFLPTLVELTKGLNDFVGTVSASQSGIQTLAKILAAPIMAYYWLARAIAEARLAFEKFNLAIAQKTGIDSWIRAALVRVRDATSAVLEYEQKIARLESNVAALGKFDYDAARAAEQAALALEQHNAKAEAAAKEREKRLVAAMELQQLLNNDAALYAKFVEAAGNVWQKDVLPGIKESALKQKELGEAIDRYATSLANLGDLKIRGPFAEAVEQGQTFEELVNIQINKTIPDFVGANKRAGESIADIWSRQVSTIVSDWARGITDMIFSAKDFGEKLKNIFVETAQSIVRTLMESLFKPLQDLLSKFISSLTSSLGTFGQLAIGGGILAISLLWNKIFGKDAAVSAGKEAGRDFGIALSKQTWESFTSGLGFTSSSQWAGIRKDLESSPLFLATIAGPQAQASGTYDQFLKRLESVSTSWGNFNFRNAFELGSATGDWSLLNKQFTEAFQTSEALRQALPDWQSKLTMLNTSAENMVEALTADADAFSNLMAAMQETLPAADDMYQTFLKTGEILPGLAAAIEKYGGNLDVFRQYAAIVPGLRQNLSAIGDLMTGLNQILPEEGVIQMILGGKGFGASGWNQLLSMGLDPSKLINIADLTTYMTGWQSSVSQFQQTGNLPTLLQQGLWKYGGSEGMNALANIGQGFNTITPGLLDKTFTAITDAFNAERTSITDYLQSTADSIQETITNATQDVIDELGLILQAIQDGFSGKIPLAEGASSVGPNVTVVVNGNVVAENFPQMVAAAVRGEYNRYGMAYMNP